MNQTLKQCQELIDEQHWHEARELLTEGCQEAVATLPSGWDAPNVLSHALQHTEKVSNDLEAVAILQGSTRQAVASLKFRPLMEATLPKDHPQPSPVGQIRVKHYPRLRKAMVQTDSQEADRDRSMFMTLFSHIKKNNIAMTTPVEMRYTQTPREHEELHRRAMAFYYRSTELGTAGQVGSVHVVDTEPALFVSVGLRGSYTDKNFRKGLMQLRNWLDRNDLTYKKTGEPRVLAYNSPFVLWFLKYSEVQIPVERIGDPDKIS
jgi:hypothetical protein